MFENITLMAILSLAVIGVLVVVLVGFVQQITRILTHTANTLDIGKGLAGGIRRDCQSIIDAVVKLNANLRAAAGGLTSVANAAQRKAVAVATAPPAPAPAPAPAEPAAPVDAAAAAEARAAWMSEPRGRFARHAAPAPAPAAPAEPEPEPAAAAADDRPFRPPSS